MMLGDAAEDRARVGPRRVVLGLAGLALSLAVTGCGVLNRPAPLRPVGPARVTGPVLVAAGDIACPAGEQVTPAKCHMADTARLATKLRPRVVVTLGDQQYLSATSRDYGVYDRTWGTLKSITRPVLGDHGDKNYVPYFRQQLPRRHPAFYAYDVGTWRVYALDSTCRGSACEPQARWLDRDMTANPRKCTLLTMHRPRYSSGRKHGGTADVKPFWDVAVRHHADVALAGHEHNYERFDRMNGSDGLDDVGIRSFVVGTGGKNLYGFTKPTVGSTVREETHFGVLALRLGDDSYSWRHETIDEGVVDAGTSYCI